MPSVKEQAQDGIVIVGGGAAGSELAVRLGRRLGPERVTLVDKSSLHVWKPSLHEVAAGTLDIHREGLSYFMLAKERGFTFAQGEMAGLDRRQKTVALKPLRDARGREILPARTLRYGVLVLAVGSTSHFFGTPGVAEHGMTIDSTEQAKAFRLQLLAALTRCEHDKRNGRGRPLQVAIVGGGATGVEFAAELVDAVRHLVHYGLQHLDPVQDIRVTLLEGAPRILPPLPERVAQAAHVLLQKRHIVVKTSVRVASMDAEALHDSDDNSHPYDLCLWAAGIKAPHIVGELQLPTNAIGQIIADRQLRTADPSIFALGDCAQVPDAHGRPLPARAQVAHQQAAYLYHALKHGHTGTGAARAPFVYRDYGSLVSLGQRRAVGQLMGVLSRQSFFTQGLFTRGMYASLHLSHHAVLLGAMRTAAIAAARLFVRRWMPRVKLH